MVDQQVETEKQRLAREKREARVAEAAEALVAVGQEPEKPAEAQVPEEDPAAETGEARDPSEITDQGPAEDEGQVTEDTVTDSSADSVIVTPEVFNVVEVETVSARDHANLVLAGETPVTYRGVIEFNPPRLGMKKNPETGTREIRRIEFFFNDPHVFYWLHSRISREMADHTHPDIVRAEAVILKEGSTVIWQDRNPEETA